MEEWKVIPIEALDGRYEVSSLGRIRRTARVAYYSDGRKRKLQEKILAPHRHPKGYIIINLKQKDRSHTYKLHRLVAITFIPNPNEYPEVNHKDENKTNNCVENLEWCTHQYNSVYGTRLQRLGEQTSKRQKGRKLSEETKRRISEARKLRK